MSKFRRCALHLHWFTAAAWLLASGCAPAMSPDLTADEFDSHIEVRTDGSLDVVEEMHIRAGAASTTTFERVVSSGEVDRFSFAGASLDGAPVAPGAGGDTTITVKDGKTLRVRWRFRAAPQSAHVLGLRYRAAGGMGVQGAHGFVLFPAIAANRPYAIASSRIALAVPAGAVMYEPCGIMEPGWTIERRDDGLVATRHSVPATDGATVRAEFSIEDGSVAEPTWQFDRELSDEFWLAHLSGGLFILVIGIGVLWILRFQHPRSKVVLAEDAAAAHPGDIEHDRPGIARALRNAAWVCLVVALVTAVVCYLSLDRYGVWLLAIPASIVIDALAFLVASRRY